MNNFDSIMKQANAKIELVARLEGVSALSISEIAYYTNSNNQKIASFPRIRERYALKEICAKDIIALRMSRKPYFVLKDHGKYFYTEIPKSLNLISQNLFVGWDHLCSSGRNRTDCGHLSAALNCNGGCAKVRDTYVEFYTNLGYEPQKAMKSSKRLEKYDFIQVGYETFNCSQECFVVLKCNNYEISIPKEQINSQKAADLKLSLAQYMWPEVTSQPEARKKMRKNGITEFQYCSRKGVSK